MDKYLSKNKIIYTKKQLYNLYIKRELSTVEIAKLLNRGTYFVNTMLKIFKIKVRNISESQKIHLKHHPELIKRAIGRLKPGGTGKNNHNYKGGILSKKYYCIDCKSSIISLNNHYYGNSRCRSCARKEQYKNPKNHPNWLGGISFELYTSNFNNNLKEKILKRDNYKCQICGKTQKQELKELKRKLAIHHIDYNKKNCGESNLISLCSGCHTKTTNSRDYWYAYFIYRKEILK